MKALFYSIRILAAIAIGLLLFGFSCNKDNDDDNNDNQGKMWDPGWLIGTWEGTTPSTITPFAGTKIRIVFNEYNLESYDTLPGNIRKLYAYSGVFTWDVDDTAWTMGFTHVNYPSPDYDVIIWDCLTYNMASTTMNNVSLRVTDTIQVDPYHTFDLDWGPFADVSGTPPGYLDFYGDIQIDMNGTLFRAEYPPDQTSTMIRLTKK
jgi:hypothetical protein